MTCILCSGFDRGEMTRGFEDLVSPGFWETVNIAALTGEATVDGYSLCAEHRCEQLAPIFAGWAARRDRAAREIGLEVVSRDPECSPEQVRELMAMGSRELFEAARRNWRAACEVHRRRKIGQLRILKLWAEKIALGVELYLDGRCRPASSPSGWVRYASLDDAMRQAHDQNWA